MTVNRRCLAFVVSVLVLLTSVLTFDVAPANAIEVPETMAQKVDVSNRVETPGFSIDFVAVTWQGEHGEAQVRLRHGNAWSQWQAMPEDGIEREGEFGSALVPANDATAYQVRVPGQARAPKVVAINTTDGPKVTVAREPKKKAGAAGPLSYVSRSQWGADEKLRFNSAGAESWPKEYFPVQKMTVHHTATANNDVNPAATVRAIYRYHAIDRAWGDIGYQFLVDESGKIYEGRHTDNDAATPPAYQGANGVVAAHAAGYNSGNIGVAMIGTLTDKAPTAPAQSSTEAVLADVATRSNLDPRASSTYTNPSSGAKWTGPNIAGHRDYGSTECPGNRTYALLPTIRQNVWNRMQPPATTTTTTAPVTTTTVPPTTTSTVPVTTTTVPPTTTTVPTTTTTTAPPRDTKAPVLTSITATPGTTTAAFAWKTTADLSNSKVQYWKYGTTTVRTVTDARLLENHALSVTGLTGRTIYAYVLSSTDAAGNTGTSPTQYFVTK